MFINNNDFIPDDEEGPDCIIRDNTQTGGTNNVPKGINRLSRKYYIIDILLETKLHTNTNHNDNNYTSKVVSQIAELIHSPNTGYYWNKKLAEVPD